MRDSYMLLCGEYGQTQIQRLFLDFWKLKIKTKSEKNIFLYKAENYIAIRLYRLKCRIRVQRKETI